MTNFPIIQPYQMQILCNTSMLFFLPFMYSMLYKDIHKMSLRLPSSEIILPIKNNDIKYTLGFISYITGICSMLYWHDQNHDSWRYYLDLYMAKFSGICFFINGYMYILSPYKRRIAYTLCLSTIGFYYLSNTQYFEGKNDWYIWHGIMHMFTIVGQTWVIHCI